MTTKKMVVNIKEGPEGKPPIAMFVQVASQFESKIYLEMEDKRINAKSIMGMMTLGLTAGEKVIVTAEGTDEENAVDGIEKYLTVG